MLAAAPLQLNLTVRTEPVLPPVNMPKQTVSSYLSQPLPGFSGIKLCTGQHAIAQLCRPVKCLMYILGCIAQRHFACSAVCSTFLVISHESEQYSTSQGTIVN